MALTLTGTTRATCTAEATGLILIIGGLPTGDLDRTSVTRGRVSAIRDRIAGISGQDPILGAPVPVRAARIELIPANLTR